MKNSNDVLKEIARCRDRTRIRKLADLFLDQIEWEERPRLPNDVRTPAYAPDLSNFVTVVHETEKEKFRKLPVDDKIMALYDKLEELHPAKPKMHSRYCPYCNDYFYSEDPVTVKTFHPKCGAVVSGCMP